MSLVVLLAAPLRAQEPRAPGTGGTPSIAAGSQADKPSGKTKTAEPAKLPAAPAPAPAPEPIPDSDASELDEPLAEAPAPAAGGENLTERGNLSQQLQQLKSERASVTWPAITTIAGAAIIVMSTAVAAGDTFGCDGPGCKADNWAAVGVVFGTFVATGGAIWLVRLNDDNAEVDVKRRAIEQDLQRLDARQERARASGSGGGQQLSMRFHF